MLHSINLNTLIINKVIIFIKSNFVKIFFTFSHLFIKIVICYKLQSWNMQMIQMIKGDCISTVAHSAMCMVRIVISGYTFWEKMTKFLELFLDLFYKCFSCILGVVLPGIQVTAGNGLWTHNILVLIPALWTGIRSRLLMEEKDERSLINPLSWKIFHFPL